LGGILGFVKSTSEDGAPCQKASVRELRYPKEPKIRFILKAMFEASIIMNLRKVIGDISTIGALGYTIISFLQALGFLPFPLYPESGKFLLDYFAILETVFFFVCAFYIGYRFSTYRSNRIAVGKWIRRSTEKGKLGVEGLLELVKDGGEKQGHAFPQED
jgi:hypothetical protein